MIPRISDATLNAYTEPLEYIEIITTTTYNVNTGAIDAIQKISSVIYGTVLDLKPNELQTKPLELQKQHWKAFIINASEIPNGLKLNNYIKYNNETFRIHWGFVGSNFFIYHCCQNENV
jgi:hypothetical protein